jgi:hypothetical protein
VDEAVAEVTGSWLAAKAEFKSRQKNRTKPKELNLLVLVLFKLDRNICLLGFSSVAN